MPKILAWAAAWLFLRASAAELPEVAEHFRLVDPDGRDILSEAAAHPAWGGKYQPSANVLDLSFRSHGQNFTYRLYRQNISSSGGSVTVRGGGGSVRRKALGQRFVFRSPRHDAVLTPVGRSFHGTARSGARMFDIEHQVGSATLRVARVTPPPGELVGLYLNGSAAGLAGGRQLKFAPEQIDRWEGCYNDDHVMRQFEFGAIVTSNVWRKYGFQDDEDAEEWVNAIVAKANMVYEPQLNVHLKLGSLEIQRSHDATAEAWDQSDQCTMTINEQLDALSSWTPPAGTAMGTWHLFDDCFVSGTIGLAYLGARRS